MAALGARCMLPIPFQQHSKSRSTHAAPQRVRRTLAAPVAKFYLKELPYPLDALEPHISKQTLEFHWGKHHRGYVDNLNKQIENTDLERNSLEEIVKISYNNGNPSPAFNNAGQAWNHEFYWDSIKPGGGGKPTGELFSLIERDFGDFEIFLTDFQQAGATQFGSGWAWLVGLDVIYIWDAQARIDSTVLNCSPELQPVKDAKLVIEKTPNAISPLIWGHIPLLVVDVWEHAYYLDFQNRRADYLSTFVNELINWNAVEARLARAKAHVNFGEPNIPEM